MSVVALRPHRSVRDFFQALSYLQYPALAVALVYAVLAGLALGKAAQAGMAPVFDLMNYVLLYAGVGIGLSSLQDPTKTQNEMSRKVWQDPRKGRWMLALLAFYALGAMAVGLLGAYRAQTTVMNQLSLGLVALGLGMVGLLKTCLLYTSDAADE